MARTNIPLSFIAATASTADPTPTAVDQANGMNISRASSAVPFARTGAILRVANTAGAPHNIIIRAGVNPPAMRKDVGDLTVSVTNGTTIWLGLLESGRFAQVDGSINVDFDSGFTGTITAFSFDQSMGN